MCQKINLNIIMLSRRKGATKRCCYGICASDTRKKSFEDDLYFFINFPKPCLTYRKKMFRLSEKKHIKSCPKCKKCELWVKKCSRSDKGFKSLANVTKDTYICSLHFYGKSGPTVEYPDPLSYQEFSKICKASMTKMIKSRTSLFEKYNKINEQACVSTAENVHIFKANEKKHWNRKFNDRPILDKEQIPREESNTWRRDDLLYTEDDMNDITREKFLEDLVKQEVEVKMEPEDYFEYTPSSSLDYCMLNTQKMDTEFIKNEFDSGGYEFKCELEIESTVLQKSVSTDPSFSIENVSGGLNHSEPEVLNNELCYAGVSQGQESTVTDIDFNENRSSQINESASSSDAARRDPRTLKRKNKGMSYSCDVCGRIFLIYITLKIHRCKYVYNKSFDCKLCNVKFQSRNQLILHKHIHSIEAPNIELEEDPKSQVFRGLHNFDTNSSKPDKLLCTDDNSYICTICDANFMDPDRLAIHELKHAGKKPFRCNICDLKFVTLDRLIQHKRIHNKKQHGCES